LAPKRFNKFAHYPSDGASGGLLIGWNGSVFTGDVIYSSKFAITVLFTAQHNAEKWKITTVYGPCHGRDRQEFVDWLNSIQIQNDENWLFVGDFNFYRLQNRNKDGGNIQDIMVFNSIISNLGLQEIPLKGRKFTWSNMQQEPLLEQLDWCFTSVNWTSDYPKTLMYPLARITSDHAPCVIQISTSVPKAQVFRFENFWLEHPDFIDIVKSAWGMEIRANNTSSKISAKFKLLRRVLKRWSKGLAKFKQQLKQCNEILEILDKLEENRPLYNVEAAFRTILKRHVTQLLKNQKSYWKQRYTTRWTKLGDESTKFFHAAATERYRLNTITSLETQEGRTVSSHLTLKKQLYYGRNIKKGWESILLEYCIGRVCAAATTGLQPIRVWGGATLAAGCCLP
jgi:hypothetical protein